MKRIICAALAVAFFVVPTGADAQSLRTKYLELRGQAQRQFGKEEVKVDLVRQGKPIGIFFGFLQTRPATHRELVAAVVRFDRKLHPPAPPAPVALSTPVVSSTSSTPQTVQAAPAPSGGGGGGGCTGMSAESGSAGYNAYNPAGGYIGCYQIGPQHYSSGGSCAGLGTDPAGQDACAKVICQTEGPGAWTNSAGQNPCGRL